MSVRLYGLVPEETMCLPISTCSGVTTSGLQNRQLARRGGLNHLPFDTVVDVGRQFLKESGYQHRVLIWQRQRLTF
jgi:hypothetical protein